MLLRVWTAVTKQISWRSWPNVWTPQNWESRTSQLHLNLTMCPVGLDGWVWAPPSPLSDRPFPPAVFSFLSCTVEFSLYWTICNRMHTCCNFFLSTKTLSLPGFPFRYCPSSLIPFSENSGMELSKVTLPTSSSVPSWTQFGRGFVSATPPKWPTVSLPVTPHDWSHSWPSASQCSLSVALTRWSSSRSWSTFFSWPLVQLCHLAFHVPCWSFLFSLLKATALHISSISKCWRVPSLVSSPLLSSAWDPLQVISCRMVGTLNIILLLTSKFVSPTLPS